MSETDRRTLEDKYGTSPPLPGGRPPTREEVWLYVCHWYDDLKEQEELQLFAKQMFVGNYVYAVNFNGWTNPPDWKEEEPVVAAACPAKPFPAGANHEPEVYRLLALQKGGQ